MDYNPPSLKFRILHPTWIFDFYLDGDYYVHRCNWWFTEKYKINGEEVDKDYFFERLRAYKEVEYYSYL